MTSYDLLVIGGGIHGAAIARDAAGRGLSVLLVEKDDLAGHTSSASSKLIHGGLRYLERMDLKLVRESLQERETLLRTAPHLVRPLRFVLPHAPGMRPWWMVRAGLALYDLLAGFRSSLGRARGVGRGEIEFAAPLKPQARGRLASYWDAWGDDARLTVLNAVDAAERGAEIATRTTFVSAQRIGAAWKAELSGGRTVSARMIANAAGPWVAEVAGRCGALALPKVRLVKGSHIVVPALHGGEHGYTLQQPDGRVVFALPFHGFTLVGTTDIAVDDPADAIISEQEAGYLCAAVNRWFESQVGSDDVIWRFSGVRALHDDGRAEAQAVSRDHRLELDPGEGPKLVSLIGGKLTTARAVAAETLDLLGAGGLKWTRTTPLPGGDLNETFMALVEELGRWLPGPLRLRLARSYGTRLPLLLAGARDLKELGRHFGAGLYEAEVRYLVAREFARSADDILWRRTRLGLDMSAAERDRLARWLDRGTRGARR